MSRNLGAKAALVLAFTIVLAAMAASVSASVSESASASAPAPPPAAAAEPVPSPAPAYPAPRRLRVARVYRGALRVRWIRERRASWYLVQAHNRAGALIRSFATRHDYANVGDLRPGQKYTVRVRVNVPGSRLASVGVRTRFAQTLNQRIAAYARTFPGRYPYIYGGSSPATGFDCSGLAQYVYRHFGRTIPRTSREQYRYFRAESRSSAEPGDLVFFFGDGTVYHVGIYEGGHAMVAAADEAEGIRYQRIYSSDVAFGTLTH